MNLLNNSDAGDFANITYTEIEASPPVAPLGFPAPLGKQK